MKIELKNEVNALQDGIYKARIHNVFEFPKGEKISLCVEFALDDEDGTIFNKFYDDPDKKLGSYPWSAVFKALNSSETSDLIGQKVEFEVKNNTKDDRTYSNIKKITLI